MIGLSKRNLLKMIYKSNLRQHYSNSFFIQTSFIDYLFRFRWIMRHTFASYSKSNLETAKFHGLLKPGSFQIKYSGAPKKTSAANNESKNKELKVYNHYSNGHDTNAALVKHISFILIEIELFDSNLPFTTFGVELC